MLYLTYWQQITSWYDLAINQRLFVGGREGRKGVRLNLHNMFLPTTELYDARDINVNHIWAWKSLKSQKHQLVDVRSASSKLQYSFKIFFALRWGNNRFRLGFDKMYSKYTVPVARRHFLNICFIAKMTWHRNLSMTSFSALSWKVSKKKKYNLQFRRICLFFFVKMF